ncbi:MAG: hypothetical protein JWQ18_489, partial [Conexibacter sp.]|nr:hypothetical protein [Conexibacter sp.]
MARLLDAALLGAVAGSRTFTAPAALAARGRLGGPAGSKIIMMAAAGGPGAAAGALGAGLATVGAY